jgi:hypothetical protein
MEISTNSGRNPNKSRWKSEEIHVDIWEIHVDISYWVEGGKI